MNMYYHELAVIWLFADGTGEYQALERNPGASLEKGGEDVICMNPYKSLCFLRLSRYAYQFAFKPL
jgi:hypothetical protein